jgi:hypothetical protein
MAIVLASMHATPMQGQTGPDPESELRTGIDLTRQGMLVQAIPQSTAIWRTPINAWENGKKPGRCSQSSVNLCSSNDRCV